MLTLCPSTVFRGDIHFSIAESGKMDTPNISGKRCSWSEGQKRTITTDPQAGCGISLKGADLSTQNSSCRKQFWSRRVYQPCKSTWTGNAHPITLRFYGPTEFK